MSHLTSITQSNQPVMYEIRVEGQLTTQWTTWFDGMTILPQANGDTVLRGAIIDQSALFGILKKIRDVGMALVSVNRVTRNSTAAPQFRREEKNEP